MASRDTELSAFIDARGPALMRTASLLVLDDAEAVLASALARTARRWREASRDDDVERVVRAELYDQALARWRKAGGVEIGDEDAAATPEPPARRALRALTRQQRAVVVLRSFEGLDVGEVAALLRMRSAEVEAMRQSTVRRLTESEPRQPLDEVFRVASVAEVPVGLTARVQAESRSQGRRTWLVAAVVLAVLAVGAFLLRDAPPGEPAAPGVGRWGIPAQLPAFRGLPDLGEQPIEVASAAYVVDGVPVVVDARSGQARRVFRRGPAGPAFDYNVQERESALFAPRGTWTDAALAPDGTRLLLAQAPGPTDGGPRRVYLLDLAGMTMARVAGMVLVTPDVPVGAVGSTGLAWAPDAEAFACACAGRLVIGTLGDSPDEVTLTSTSWPATGVAWGGVGVAARAGDGAWALIDAGGELRLDTLSFADALAMSASRPPQYLTATTGRLQALPGDTRSDGARCVLWDDDMTNPVLITPVPIRDGSACIPQGIGPGRSAFVLVVSPTGPTAPASGPDVVVVASDGSSEPVSVLPHGTTSASFAASLVG